jgi:hypothetical protein
MPNSSSKRCRELGNVKATLFKYAQGRVFKREYQCKTQTSMDETTFLEAVLKA